MKNLTICQYVLICLLFFNPDAGYSQMLFPESFTLILDTTRTVQGSFSPKLKHQNLKRNLLEFENVADISIRLTKNVITFANKVEVARFGSETLLSGGYVYGEYRNIYTKKLALEAYSQIHWADARGLEWRYGGGINTRWRVFRKDNIAFSLGAGPFYEFERWNYGGIADESLIPQDTEPVEKAGVKLGSYASLKYAPFKSIFIDLSLYHQASFNTIFSTPRLGSSSSITYRFSDHLGLALVFQNIYDPRPVVPIDRHFKKIELGLNVSF